MGWIYLILAGLFELGFSSFLKLSEGLTKPYAIVTFIGFGVLISLLVLALIGLKATSSQLN